MTDTEKLTIQVTTYELPRVITFLEEHGVHDLNVLKIVDAPTRGAGTRRLFSIAFKIDKLMSAEKDFNTFWRHYCKNRFPMKTKRRRAR